MNRRAFMTGLLGIGIGAKTPSLIDVRGFGEEWVARGYQARNNDETEAVRLSAKVERFISAPGAERGRQLALREPILVANTSEISITNPQNIDIPVALQNRPGAIARFTTFVGAAAVEGTIIIAAFRFDSIIWTVRAYDDVPELVIALAQAATTGRESGAEALADEGYQTGGLWDLLPVPEDFPDGAVITGESTPDEMWAYGI